MGNKKIYEKLAGSAEEISKDGETYLELDANYINSFLSKSKNFSKSFAEMMENFEEKRLAYFKENPILGIDGNPLTPEECVEYEDDVFDCGIPMGPEAAKSIKEKWGKKIKF